MYAIENNVSTLSPIVAASAAAAKDAATVSNGAVNHHDYGSANSVTEGDKVSLSPAAKGSITGGSNDPMQASFADMGNRVASEWSAVKFNQLLENVISAMEEKAGQG